MRRLFPNWLALMVLATAPGFATSLCVTGTLASYEALGAGGCTLDGHLVKSFSYSMISGTVTIPDTSIIVTPSVGFDSMWLTFSSTDFSVSGTDSAVYLLAYTWDPQDIRSLEDILNANSPVYPGLAMITTEDCEDAAFSGAACPTSTDTIVVSDDGHTLISPTSVSFSPPLTVLGIRDTIELDGNGASSEFTSFENLLTVPEPSTLEPCLLLAALVLGRLRFQRI